MELLDLTLTSPEENLALDEALLDEAESGTGPDEVLRLWEAPRPVVVLGRTSRIDEEVRLDYCQRAGAAVLRRCSGGASILAGPGCLMYAVVLSYSQRPELRPLDQAHAFVLAHNVAAVRALADDPTRFLCSRAEPLGTSDLAIDGRKFSGNSLRCKRTHFLYHGTLLYDFPLEEIGRCLRQPSRQPDYRQNRDHDEFLMNLPSDAATLRTALQSAWNIQKTTTCWPRERVASLVNTRYGQEGWNAGCGVGNEGVRNSEWGVRSTQYSVRSTLDS
jgi:lipoate-protein ligase A